MFHRKFQKVLIISLCEELGFGRNETDRFGYEINFTKYFYEYMSPGPLKEIESDIKEVIAEIRGLLKEEL